MNYDYNNDIMRFWECCDSVDLSNYYTKPEVDEKIAEIEVSGTTPEQVQAMIDESVNPIADVVRQQGEAILNRYTKEETNDLLTTYLSKIEANSMIAGYAAIDGTTLILNNENITI